MISKKKMIERFSQVKLNLNKIFTEDLVFEKNGYFHFFDTTSFNVKDDMWETLEKTIGVSAFMKEQEANLGLDFGNNYTLEGFKKVLQVIKLEYESYNTPKIYHLIYNIISVLLEIKDKINTSSIDYYEFDKMHDLGHWRESKEKKRGRSYTPKPWDHKKTGRLLTKLLKDGKYNCVVSCISNAIYSTLEISEDYEPESCRLLWGNLPLLGSYWEVYGFNFHLNYLDLVPDKGDCNLLIPCWEGQNFDQTYLFTLAKALKEVLIETGRLDCLSILNDHVEELENDIESLLMMIEYYLAVKKTKEATYFVEKVQAIEPNHVKISSYLNEIKSIETTTKIIAEFSLTEDGLNGLSGQEFEELLIGQFNKMKFNASRTPTSGDYGADIIIETEQGTRIVVQCKRFKAKVNLKAVQEVVGAISYYNCDFGIVVTNSTFLNSAVKLAKSNDIELWNGNKLFQFLSGDVSFSEISDL